MLYLVIAFRETPLFPIRCRVVKQQTDSVINSIYVTVITTTKKPLARLLAIPGFQTVVREQRRGLFLLLLLFFAASRSKKLTTRHFCWFLIISIELSHTWSVWWATYWHFNLQVETTIEECDWNTYLVTYQRPYSASSLLLVNHNKQFYGCFHFTLPRALHLCSCQPPQLSSIQMFLQCIL